MSEEQDTFTFVDKRRTQVESASSETSNAAPVDTPSPTESAAEDRFDDDDETDAPPDTYSLIGYCISLLASDAWQKLGLLADPKSGQAQPDLPQAKVAIDAVGDLAARLETASQEAVPESLRRDLRTLVNDLHLNYVSQQSQGR
jgi:hypothetical protein